MSPVRLHVPRERWTSRLELSPSEKHYLVDVLRQRLGSKVEIFDGIRTICQATLCREDNKWLLRLGPIQDRPDPITSVFLGVALLKGKKFDRVVRVATEVGIATIQPFSCQRSVSRPDMKSLAAKEVRWRAVAAEAARQCRRASLPVLQSCKPLDEIFEHCSTSNGAILHQGVTEPTLLEWLQKKTSLQELLLLVGPEGGFTSKEIEKALTAGFDQVSLGLPVLRAETAAVIAGAFACCHST